MIAVPAIISIAAVIKIIACAILSVFLMHIQTRNSKFQFFKFIGHSLPINFFNRLRIFLFCIRFIENAIFLTPKPNTPDTIIATNAIITKFRVISVNTIFAVIAVVTLLTVDAFVAKSALPHICAIATIFIFIRPKHIKTIPVSAAAVTKIAIIIIGSIRGIIAVFTPRGYHCARLGLTELL